jgi:hypothetical protein
MPVRSRYTAFRVGLGSLFAQKKLPKKLDLIRYRGVKLFV